MDLIIDADVIIREEKGGLSFSEWLVEHSNDVPHLAAITISELWHGVWRAKTTAQRQKRIAHLERYDGINILSFDERVARKHSELWAILEMTGTPIGAHDTIVAATALYHQMTLVTNNEKHFRKVPGLDIITL